MPVRPTYSPVRAVLIAALIVLGLAMSTQDSRGTEAAPTVTVTHNASDMGDGDS